MTDLVRCPACGRLCRADRPHACGSQWECWSESWAMPGDWTTVRAGDALRAALEYAEVVGVLPDGWGPPGTRVLVRPAGGGEEQAIQVWGEWEWRAHEAEEVAGG